MVTVVMVQGREDLSRVVRPFLDAPLVERVVVLVPRELGDRHEKMACVVTDRPAGGAAVQAALDRVRTDYVLFVDADTEVQLGQFALQRMIGVAAQTDAGMVYADYRVSRDGIVSERPVIDYQLGSIRDDFAFGPLQFYSMTAVRQALDTHGRLGNTSFAGRYELRLKVATSRSLFHVPEFLYTVVESAATAGSGSSHFAYVDPKNAAVQKEMEQVATEHLRRIGAYLGPTFELPPDGAEDTGLTEPGSDNRETAAENTGFTETGSDNRRIGAGNRGVEASNRGVEASVIIPVRNRERTIADAVNSALGQKASFPFNVIVADNHSTDRTTEILRDIAAREPRLAHIVPERHDLGIGGCWNEAVFSPACGRYAVQLDSDDLYSGPDTLEKIVAEFRRGPYAMVIGSYRIVDFQLNELPPGIIDHREWTRENGRNNALRINGLGAPRAFMTEVLRQTPFPNVSYGEDYAMVLRFSRQYEIGRIYEPLYQCRRWEDNTDAALPLAKVNQYNTYKDRLRTIEILARQQMNAALRQESGRSTRT